MAFVSLGLASDGKAASCISTEDAVVEYWAGNPSVEIEHGYLYATGGARARGTEFLPLVDALAFGGTCSSGASGRGAAGVAGLGSGAAFGAANGMGFAMTEWRDVCPSPTSEDDMPAGAGSCVVLASSVPRYMSAPEFCDFIGAFGAETHRLFRHCRVLHGRSPEEYLIALWLTSPQAAAGLIENHDGRRYNAIEAGICRLHRVVGCFPKAGSDKDLLLPRAGSPSAIVTKRGASSSSGQGASPGACSVASAPPPCAVRAPVPQRAGMRLGGGVPSPSRGPATSPVLRSMSPSLIPPVSSSPDAAAQAGALVNPEEELFRSDLAVTQGGSDNPFCAVCLEHVEADPCAYQLTELGGGVPLTILCGHTFHARCLSRWCDATCPVCRFQQHPDQTSCCDVCGQRDGIHICLVCSFIGCINEQGESHAQQHFEATSHAYALEVSTQRVWDYAGNGYVHRLLYGQSSDQDGKMVEHSMPPPSPGTPTAGGSFGTDFGFFAASTAAIGVVAEDGGIRLAAAGAPALPSMAPHGDEPEAVEDFTGGALSNLARGGGGDARDCSGSGPRPGVKKQESVLSEFNALLSSQMTAQRHYYEQRRREQERQHSVELGVLEARWNAANATARALEAELAAARAANDALEREAAEASAAEELARRQVQQLEALNKKISGEQRKFETKVESERVDERAKGRARKALVEELQQQIRDLETFIKMRGKVEASTDEVDRQGSAVLIAEGDSRGGRRGARRR